MKKILSLTIGALLVGGMQVGITHELNEGDRIVWMVGDPQSTDPHWVPAPVYVIETDFVDNGELPHHELTITQYGNVSIPQGTPYDWVPLGTIQIKKQFESDWLFRESGYLTIFGFHEVNIEAGWVNIDSEFGTIIDGEEAKTIFIPAVCK